jgi:hypothetical protein
MHRTKKILPKLIAAAAAAVAVAAAAVAVAAVVVAVVKKTTVKYSKKIMHRTYLSCLSS